MILELAADAFFRFLLLALVPLLLLIIFLRMQQHKPPHKEAPLRLPPGPWRLPIIGSLHHLVKTPLVHRTLADLARRCNAPVMYLRLGEVHAVVISSPDAAQEVMKTHDVVFATRPQSTTVRATAPNGVGLVFCPYGEQWRQLRKICNLELLSSKRVRSFRPIREDEATRLAGDITAACHAGVPVNISARIATLSTDSVLRAIVGERFKRKEEFLQTLDEGVKLAAGFNLGDLFPSSRLLCAVSGTVRKARAFQQKMFELVDEVVEQHRERRAVSTNDDAGNDDLIDVLLRIQEEGGQDCPLTMGIIKSVLLDLFAAGSETTSTTIIWAMSELMRNPKVMQKAQAELHHTLKDKTKVTEDDLLNLQYLKLVIKETLRLHPAAPLLIPRESRKSCNILGYDVPEGTFILVNAWAISTDFNYWDEPKLFKPERFEGETIDFKGTDFRYIPFGAGRRICPGVVFSQANAELILATLLFHFNWQLPDQVVASELDMEEEMGITVRRKRDLYILPTVRVPLNTTS